MTRNQALGCYGEQVAARHLEQQGLVIIGRNWRCDIGEIDIIARDSTTLVFVEVKTRTGVQFGHPLEAISDRKIRRLRRLALRWLDELSIHAPVVRFDVIGIVQPTSGGPVISHVRGIDITWR
jgi:putative endonuclease